MIGRATLPEQLVTGDIINQPGPLPMRSTRYIYISDGLGILSSPGRIRTAVAGSKGPQD